MQDYISRHEFLTVMGRVEDKLDDALRLEVRVAALETQVKAKQPPAKHVKWGTIGTFLGGFALELAHAIMKK